MREQTQKELDALDKVTRYDVTGTYVQRASVHFGSFPNGMWMRSEDVIAAVSTLRAEQTRLRDALKDLPQRIMNLKCFVPTLMDECDEEAFKSGHRDARHAATELVTAALSSTRTPRPGFDCALCGHQHQDERFAFICIGCPCQRKSSTPTPETTP